MWRIPQRKRYRVRSFALDFTDSFRPATDVEGIFRLSGSAKRIKELQALFDEPPRYGKGLDWTGYTVHDAANVLRRYLNELPQPVVPLEFYERSREPLRRHQSEAVGDIEAGQADIGDFDHQGAIVTYQQLITELPPLNRQLLLYILDLLSVFASKSDLNRMTSANLAAIFQPGMLSHPDHDMSPADYRLSQDVLIFLIDNQDSFLIGMNGTAADDETKREVESGAPSPQPTTPNRNVGLGRSASSASAGTESLRRIGGNIRRTLSISSKHSHISSNAHTPISTNPGTAVASGSGVHRSNTVPSQKSPTIPSATRINRGTESPITPAALSPALASYTGRSSSPGSKLAPLPSTSEDGAQSFTSSTTPTFEQPSSLAAPSTHPRTNRDHSKERLLPNTETSSPLIGEADPSQAAGDTPSRPSKITTLLTKSPTTEASKEPRQPKKLQKKRIPSSTQPSANSSTHSLSKAEDSPRNAVFSTPMATPAALQNPADPISAALPPSLSNTAATPVTEATDRSFQVRDETTEVSTLQRVQQPSDSTLRAKSAGNSVHSKTSVTDHSEQENSEEAKDEKPEKKRRWRFSSAPKKNEQPPQISSPPLTGLNKTAGVSSSTIESWQKARKSMSNDIPTTTLDTVPSNQAQNSTGSDNSNHKDESEKKGLFGRIKAKVSQSKEEKKEKEAERERAKSPHRETNQRDPSIAGLASVANESAAPRGQPTDIPSQPVA